MLSFRQILLVGLLAAGLSFAFWSPLFTGGGFVGGDVYSYYFPQKVFYSESLRGGEIPLWNHRTGHGYPLVGESQTGVFYPFHLLLYSTLDVNTAYNVNHLLHYGLAFLFTWMYARSVGLSSTGSLLAGIVFSLGWFPSRNCWEWAILGGVWMPLALWCVERFLQTRLWRYAFGLTAALTLQMLAGHFNLAFFTQLLVAIYIPARLWLATSGLPPSLLRKRIGAALLLVGALGFSFLLAAVQLWPTWELRARSQRATLGEHHPLTHGSIPLNYLSQAVAPWYWYSPLVDRDLQLKQKADELGALTNQVEAHLYFGLVPLALALIGIVSAIRRRERLWLVWLAVGLLALAYTTGRLVPLTQMLPGFSFFQGPGRYGVITTLVVGLLAARGYDTVASMTSLRGALIIGAVTLLSCGSMWWLVADTNELSAQSGWASPLVMGTHQLTSSEIIGLALVNLVAVLLVIFTSSGRNRPSIQTGNSWRRQLLGVILVLTTTVDLWIVGRLVTYSPMVDDPPVSHLAESPLRQELQKFEGTPRLHAPGANLPNVLADTVPEYLTFGPSEYLESRLESPDVGNSAAIQDFYDAGVTHLLSFTPLASGSWPLQLVWQGYDPVLNPAWARREPIYLYELEGSPGRAYFADPRDQQQVTVTEFSPHRVVIDAESTSGGLLVLTDLMYPGWQVTVDGRQAQAQRYKQMYRAVELSPGEHTVVWNYRPGGVYWGFAVSGTALLILAALAHVRFWQPRRLSFLDDGDPKTDAPAAEAAAADHAGA